MNFLTKLFSIAILLVATGTSIFAQQPAKHPAIVLYNENKFAEAIASLEKALKQKEFKDNAELLNYLGLSLIENGNPKKAKKSLEKAVSLAPTNLGYRVNLAYAYLSNREVNKSQAATEEVLKLDPKNIPAIYLHGIANSWERKLDAADADADRILSLDPAYPEAYLLKSNTQIARMGAKIAGSELGQEISYLKSAAEILETGISRAKGTANYFKLEAEYESVNIFYNYFKNRKPWVPGTVVTPDPGVTPLKIISKPRPMYTESARQAGSQGTIQLAILFGANGRIANILVLKGLGYGLDQQAFAAARKITFEPKLQDGKPVSTVKIVEYTFSIF